LYNTLQSDDAKNSNARAKRLLVPNAVEDSEDPEMEVALKASLAEPAERKLEELDTVSAINETLSSALLDSQDWYNVVVLKFKRSPKLFLDVLMNADALAPYRNALEERSYSVILPGSEAKIFVHPRHYDPVLASLAREGHRLHKDNVIVEPELEGVVIELLGRIVKMKNGSRFTISLNVSADDGMHGNDKTAASEDIEKMATQVKNESGEDSEIDEDDWHGRCHFVNQEEKNDRRAFKRA